MSDARLEYMADFYVAVNRGAVALYVREAKDVYAGYAIAMAATLAMKVTFEEFIWRAQGLL